MTSSTHLRSRRWALGAIAAAFVAGCAGPTQSSGSQLVNVALETDLGTIVIAVDAGRAPVTAANFLRYVDQGSYAGGSFYRAVTPATDNGTPPIAVIQGGRGLAQEGAAPGIAHEPTSQTGLRHVDGAISMSRGAPGTATSEFFICVGEQPALDAGGARYPDGLGFAVFGRVVSGMDVVRAIQARRADAPAPDPYAEGQMLNPPVRIVAARRQP